MKFLIPGTLLAGIALVHATPSGLNNIPTADTTPQGTFVLQGYSTFGNDHDADFFLGFKTGSDFLKPAKIELGLDSHLTPGKGGPVTFNGKVAVPLGDWLPTLAVGAANNTVSDYYRSRTGDTFLYFVASEDLHWFRVHAGIGLQDGEGQPFFGIDKTFRIARPAAPARADGKTVAKKETEYRELFTLRSDAIQQLNREWLLSAGVLVPVCKYFVFEGWANLPTDGTEASFTVKGNFVFKF